MSRVLIVDDELSQRKIMMDILSEEGYEIFDADSVDAALQILTQKQFDVIITDLKMPKKSGLDLVEAIRTTEYPPEILLITAFGTVDTAVRAMKLGAYDYLTKPIEHDELILVVKRAAEKYALKCSSRLLRDELIRQVHQGIVAQSDAMKEIIETAKKVALSDATVLIRGESGTGKERIARLIHYLSDRKDKPVQCINCAAFPDNLLESELFGYEKGAFTGAITRKPGILEAADKSTVFLDEVADMSLPLQAKLLRVLQEKEIRRLGATSTTTIDVRFIAATNKNLEECVRSGTFREDLFYRLNIIPITIPPLRQRVQDIEPMIKFFLGRKGKQKNIEKDAVECLKAYRWPGNVRELEAIMERISVLSTNETVSYSDIPLEIRIPATKTSIKGQMLPPGGLIFDEWERDLLEQALSQSNGVMTEAAKLLGMSYRTFQYRVEKFGLKTQP